MEAGFACSKSKLVQNGLLHLRPFNINTTSNLDLSTIYMIPASEAPTEKRTLLAGDILFNNTNSVDLVGKAAIVESSLSAGFSNHLTRIRVDRNRCEPSFVCFQLNHLWRNGFFQERATQWVSQAAFNATALIGLPIPLAPLDEQRRIVDLLERAAGIRRLREQALAKARAIVPALFLDMFGDFDSGSGLPISPLENVAGIGSGITKGRKLNGRPVEDTPYLRVANVQDGFLNLTEIKTIPATNEDRIRYRLQPGDLVMTEGGDPDKLGRAAIWGGEVADCLHQNHVFRVRPSRKIVLPDYLAAVIGSSYGKAYFLRVAKRTTGIASINRTQLGAFPVPVPPLNLQNAFAARLADLRSIIAQQERSLAAARELERSLMARLLG